MSGFVRQNSDKSKIYMTKLKKELRSKLPEHVVNLLELPDVVKFIKKYPGARLLNAKSYNKKKYKSRKNFS